jgi:hypothetical protein
MSKQTAKYIAAFCAGVAVEGFIASLLLTKIEKGLIDLEEANKKLHEAVVYQADSLVLMDKTIQAFHEVVDEDMAAVVRDRVGFDWVIHTGMNTPEWIADILRGEE